MNNILITKKEYFLEDFRTFINTYLNVKTYGSCRNSFKNQYAINIFERNLLSILNTKVN